MRISEVLLMLGLQNAASSYSRLIVFLVDVKIMGIIGGLIDDWNRCHI